MNSAKRQSKNVSSPTEKSLVGVEEPEKKRDSILLKLLKMPPHQRPKRDRITSKADARTE